MTQYTESNSAAEAAAAARARGEVKFNPYTPGSVEHDAYEAGWSLDAGRKVPHILEIEAAMNKVHAAERSAEPSKRVWWGDADLQRVLIAGAAAGHLYKASHTQVQWTESGIQALKAARADVVAGGELAEGHFEVGQKVVFNSTHSAAKQDGRLNVEVEIVRPLTDQEADLDEVGPMYKIRFADGHIEDAFADELSPRKLLSGAEKMADSRCDAATTRALACAAVGYHDQAAKSAYMAGRFGQPMPERLAGNEVLAKEFKRGQASAPLDPYTLLEVGIAEAAYTLSHLPKALAQLKSIIDWTGDDHDMPTEADAKLHWYARRLSLIRNAARSGLELPIVSSADVGVVHSDALQGEPEQLISVTDVRSLLDLHREALQPFPAARIALAQFDGALTELANSHSVKATAGDAQDDIVYVLVQEGGASDELYIHAHPSPGEAEDDRHSCAEAAYRTSDILSVPRSLADQPGFYEILEDVLRASNSLSYPEPRPDEDTEPSGAHP